MQIRTEFAENEILSETDVLLRDRQFKRIETLGKITFFDPERKEGISILGEFEKGEGEKITQNIISKLDHRHRIGVGDGDINKLFMFIQEEAPQSQFQNITTQAVVNKIKEQPEDTWLRPYEYKSDEYILAHTFGDKKAFFKTEFDIHHREEYSAISFYPDYQSLLNDENKAGPFGIPYEEMYNSNDFNVENMLAMNAVKLFEQKQNFNKDDMQNYLASKCEKIKLGIETLTWKQTRKEELVQKKVYEALEEDFPTPAQSLDRQLEEEVEFERWLDPYEFIDEHPEDVWAKYSNDPEKTLKHVFKIDGGYATVRFQLAPPSSEKDTETAIIFNREPDGQHASVSVEADIDTAKAFVANTIKHFDKERDMSLNDIAGHLKSQFTEYQKAERELVKKAGYVQGVCECVAAIGDGYAFGKKLLSEMNVTKDMAKKYANPETYKALEQGIFAPRHEQKQEQSHSIRR